MNALVLPAGLEPDPMEIDPRPCQVCGLTIDRHKMIDNGEGPEFFCIDYYPEELSLAELERRAELRAEEEIAWIVSQMEAADGPYEPPRPAEPPPYRTPQATIDAFWYVVGLGDPERFKAWLANHPRDASFLLKLLEGK
jgi:hypothetical protein